MGGLRKAITFFSQNSNLAFVQNVTEEQVQLLVYQKELEQKYGSLTKTRLSFTELSVSETMHNLLVLASSYPTERVNLLAEAAKMKNKFAVRVSNL